MFLPMPMAMMTTRHATCAGCCPSPFSACFPRRRFPRVGCCPSRIIRACRARPVDPRGQRRTGPPVSMTPHMCCVTAHWCVPALRVVHCFLINHVCQICAPSAAQPARTATRARLVRRTRHSGDGTAECGVRTRRRRVPRRPAAAPRPPPRPPAPARALGFCPHTRHGHAARTSHAPRTPRTRRVDILS